MDSNEQPEEGLVDVETPEIQDLDSSSGAVPGENILEETHDKIVPMLVEDEMKKAYITYAMAVIVGRALPDVRDGLKPVHRRILYAMHDLGMFHNKPSKKSARIVGEVLGKYHPHGDQSVYDALVRMVQGFSLRYPLIKGQGNFGSIDGDNAAAMRYTEAKLSKLAEEMLADLKKDTVDFRGNFDESLKEPTVLPSRIPNLLMNGSSGIAVGMATNIPPHNLTELCNAILAILDNPEVELSELVKLVPGPDFPTGAEVYVGGSLLNAYNGGKGRVIMKSVAHIEEAGQGSRGAKIIVSEIPYQVNKSDLIIHIASLVKEKRVEGISDINDESDRDGIRVVIKLKTNADAQIVLNQLYKFSNLKTSFNLNMLALVDNSPRMLGLKDMLVYYIAHRKEIVVRRTQYELRQAESRLHILEGLLIALINLDDVIPAIRSSKSVEDARNHLITEYSLSLEQAKAILELKLQKLAALEREKIKSEHDALVEIVTELKSILASEERIYKIIRDETVEVSEKYGGPRRSKIIFNEDDDLDIEDLIEEEQVVITLTNAGYLKRLPVDTYRVQNRGGKGVVAQGMKDGDFVDEVFVCSTHAWLLLFTNLGRVHWVKTYRIPEGSRQSRGKHSANIVELGEGETVSAIIPVNSFENESAEGDDSETGDSCLFFATASGTVKKTNLSLFSRPRRGGIRAIELLEGDSLVGVRLCNGGDNILLVTERGYANRFMSENVRSMGRTARGVRGIRLRDSDKVVSVLVSNPEMQVLTITKRGYGKKSKVSDYRLSNRGGKGVINLKVTEKNGPVVSSRLVLGDEGLMLMSREGIAIRVKVSAVPTIGRATQGVRVMRFKVEGDEVAAVALIEADEDGSDGEVVLEDENLENENLGDGDVSETPSPVLLEEKSDTKASDESSTEDGSLVEDQKDVE
ncbi:DNA gyrase subunit A [archaeon]|jgi:DNA gyrase subunit A|nr:DNA gyrase subunit A [archaeon]MBT6697838.1 DNA gyrase subunit A [archaeon]